MKLTEKEMKHAIRTCHWKSDDKIPICRGLCLPCERVLEKVQCPTLIELLQKERRNERNEISKKKV